MRIIGGSAKGKKILVPYDKKTRPLKDRVKESIFNILTHSNLLKKKLNKCILLDLFSGVGSFGLEAISRGVEKVIFFESYKPSFNVLKKNIESLNFTNKSDIYRSDIYKTNDLKNINCQFDLVFFDPPFKDINFVSTLKNLVKNKKLQKSNLIIIHRHKKSQDKFDKDFKVIREEVYGISKIIFGYFTI